MPTKTPLSIFAELGRLHQCTINGIPQGVYTSDLTDILREDERLAQFLDILVPERISLNEFPPSLLEQIPSTVKAELEAYRCAEQERLRGQARILLNVYHEYQHIKKEFEDPVQSHDRDYV